MTEAKSFISWLRNQKNRNDAVGDIARDVVYDIHTGCLHESSYKSIKNHMIMEHHAIDVAIEALDKAYEEFNM